ncbi:hypothetical protein REPUB_Repub07fG0167800 [Reevesia pubescens]
MDGNNIEGSIKGESHSVPWNLLKPYIMGDSNEEQSMELFALAIYGLVAFPKVLGHIEISVIDFFGQVSGMKIDPAPSIVSNFWGTQEVPICPYFGAYIPIKEFLKKEWPKGITKEQWVTSFQSLESVNITWKAPWIATSVFVYRCGKNLWVPLPGLWGVVSYAPLLVRRQFGSQQFIPMIRGLRAFEFDYKRASYGTRVQKVIKDWKELYESGPGSFLDEVTKEYTKWRERRINDMVMTASQEAAQSIYFPLKMVISEVDIVKQELATKEKAWEREKTTLVEEAIFSKYDVMKKEAELELKTKELGIVNGDLENSKSLIKELETQVHFKAKGIKTSQKWKEEYDQLMRSKESWKEKVLQKREEAERISQELQGLKGKRKTLETRVRECEEENTKLLKLLEDDQKEIGRLVQERDM